MSLSLPFRVLARLLVLLLVAWVLIDGILPLLLQAAAPVAG
ncbi:MAG TPA: hypothetical protein VF802_02060 [Candidatus Limnocylindrales bacterium]